MSGFPGSDPRPERKSGLVAQRAGWFRPAVLLLVAMVGAGCGSGTKSCVAPATKGAVLDGFIDQLAQAMCGWEFRCCAVPEIDALGLSSYATEPECRMVTTRLLGSWMSEVRIALVGGRLSFDPTFATACLQRFTQGACNPGINQFVSSSLQSLSVWDRFSQCPNPFVGTLAEGSSCSLVTECLPGNRCVSGGVAAPDSNTVEAVRAAPILSDGLTTWGIGHCVADVRKDEACLLSQDCAPGLYCRRTDFVCARPAGEGESCVVPGGDSGNPAALIVACSDSPQQLLCVEDHCRHLPRDGEPCIGQGLNLPQCDPAPGLALACVGQGFNGNGVCKTAGKEGAPCSIENGLPPCDLPLACVADVVSNPGIGVGGFGGNSNPGTGVGGFGGNFNRGMGVGGFSGNLDSGSAIGKCGAAPAAGAPCSLDQRCAPPAVCYSNNFTGYSLCVLPPKARAGAACKSDLDCVSLNCLPSASSSLALGSCGYAASLGCSGAEGLSLQGNNPPVDEDPGALGDGGGLARDAGAEMPVRIRDASPAIF